MKATYFIIYYQDYNNCICVNHNVSYTQFMLLIYQNANLFSKYRSELSLLQSIPSLTNIVYNPSENQILMTSLLDSNNVLHY